MKGQNVVSFTLVLSPDGSVVELSDPEIRVARRVMGDEFEMEPGGMIVMSTDVNATVGSRFKGWAKGFMKTWYNRIMKDQMVDEDMRLLVEERGLDTGWSIGNLFRGRFLSRETGKMFNEKSFSVDILGVPFDFVKKAAKVLQKRFDQEAVLVINHANNKTYYIT